MTVSHLASPPALVVHPAQPSVRILHLEDSHTDSAIVRLYLNRQGLGGHVVQVDNRAGFLEQLAHDFDIVLADHSMPGFDSCEALRLVQERCPEVPFVIVSGTITEAAAVKSIKSGAADYVFKDRMQRLGPAIESALREKQHRAEHEAARRARRESEVQFAQIADAMPQLVWTTGPTGHHDYFNERWYVYTGMARPDEQGGPVREFDWNDYLHPDDVESTFARWTHSLATGEPYEIEYRFRRAADHAYRWFIGRAMPVRDEAGAVVRWFGTCTDIHDLRDAEEEIRTSEERLQLVNQATNDTVWDWDVRSETVVMNPAFTDVFGWEEPENGGFTIDWMLERIHPDDRRRVAEALHGIAWGDEQAWLAEYRFERADGTWADVLNRSHIVRSVDGRATRVVGAVVDRSVRKATERALVEAKEAAEDVARAKSSLLMNMSHEIRTPLTAVIGYAEMLAHEVPPDLLDLVEPIERGGKRLLATLNSVLDLAQIEAGALPLAAAVDLWGEAQAATTALQPLAQAKGLALGLTGPPTVARADRAALARVLTNLVGNAIKFTERGSVSVEVWSEGGNAWLRVSDTGVGIDAAFLPRVFDDFAQESSGANRSHEGNGLGLTITRGLVAKMGGAITATSEKGCGSTFTVRLPPS